MAQMQVQPPQLDTLYQGYTHELYKITGEEGYDSIMDVMQADQGTGSSATSSGGGLSGGSVTVAADAIDSGSSTSTVAQATGAATQQGKTTFDNTVPGYILGVDPTTGNAKFFIGNDTNYLNWDGDTGMLTIVGGASVSSLDIPNTTTTASFHVDNTGNTWWGANVAAGLAAAPASITSSGEAVFKDIIVGGTTTQYKVGDGGMNSFGDGGDGAGVADGSTAVPGMTLSGSIYTLTRDIYLTDLTISTGIIIKTNGYRIFGIGTLTMNGTAQIQRNGNAGTSGGNASQNIGGSAGAGGAALADGYLKGSQAGGNGAAGANGDSTSVGGSRTAQPGNPGSNGSNTNNSIGTNASSAGSGGGGGSGFNGGGSSGGASGSSGTATLANVKLSASWHLYPLLDVSSTGSTVKYDNSASPGGAGSGAGGGPFVYNAADNQGGGGGGSGGSGSGGGIIAIYFKNIVIGASASITSNGGAGGNGGNGGTAHTSAGNTGGGGGGGSAAGGNGGIIVLIYNSLTNNGVISVSGGAHGTHGVGAPGNVGGSAGSDGTDGADGSAGTIFEFQLSL